jgi:hypothetical protein
MGMRTCMQGAVVQQLDSRRAMSRAEGVKDWLLNKFGFCLLHQGPFCAAMLLQVLPPQVTPHRLPPTDHGVG